MLAQPRARAPLRPDHLGRHRPGGQHPVPRGAGVLAAAVERDPRHGVRNSLMNAGNPIFSAFAMEHVAPAERATLAAAMSVLWQVGWVIGGAWYAAAAGDPRLRRRLCRQLPDGHHALHDRHRRSTGPGSAPPIAAAWRAPASSSRTRSASRSGEQRVGATGSSSTTSAISATDGVNLRVRSPDADDRAADRSLGARLGDGGEHVEVGDVVAQHHDPAQPVAIDDRPRGRALVAEPDGPQVDDHPPVPQLHLRPGSVAERVAISASRVASGSAALR